MIYRLCLKVNYTINPHRSERDLKRRQDQIPLLEGLERRHEEFPTIALLKVNKQVRAEARPVLYSCYRWHFQGR